MENSKSKFYIKDVCPTDIMMLRFTLNPIYLRRQKYYTSSLDSICRWIIKTIVKEYKDYHDGYYSMKMMKAGFEFYLEGKDDALNDVRYYTPFLSNKVRYRLGSHWSNLPTNITKTRLDMYELLIRNKNGASVELKDSVVSSYDFDKFCYVFIKKYFPEYYLQCMKS